MSLWFPVKNIKSSRKSGYHRHRGKQMNMFPNSFISAPNISDWFKFTALGKVEMISGKVEIG